MATTTAAEQRAQAKAEYDAFLAVCPSRQLLDRISDKWVTLILCALGSGEPLDQHSGEPLDQHSGEPHGQHSGEPIDQHSGPRPMRYSELSRRLAGVSQKMLTQTLRSLERDGLLTRTATATVPVTVTYELTDLGMSLHETMRGLRAWAETHMDDVLAHRASHEG
ncbi:MULTISPECIES: winged helix-turn-helix transcriptional regulator [Pseudonocardia]|nr:MULTISPECIES: helix-turn-helix domain-containing protein [Pseudonocardia]